MLDLWRTELQWGMQRCLGEVQRLCPELFAGINPNTPYRWKRSAPRAETCGRRSLLSPADTTRLSEHIMRITDVLCLSAVTIRSLVFDCLDAEGLDVGPSYRWVTRLLHGMRLSLKKPAKCLKTVLSTSTPTRTSSSSSFAGSWRRTQSALTASSTLTRCRAAYCWCIRSAGAAAAPSRLNCRARRGGHDIHDRLQHGPCPAGHADAGKTDAVLPEQH